MLNWTTIRDFLANQINIDPKTLEYIAVFNILEGCVAGVSNRDISEINDLSLGYIQATIIEFLKVYGWNETLYINPLAIYTIAKGEKQTFNILCKNEDSYLDKNTISAYFTACENFNKISKIIEEYYDRTTPRF
jgi:hypothetical protein